MAVMPPPSLNGRPRRQLSDQIDRLDEVINGLEEYLPVAVADAARDGLRRAVHDVAAEIAGDPAILDKLRAALGTTSVAPSPPRPSAWTRLKAVVRNAAAKAAAAVGLVRHTVTTGVGATLSKTKARVAGWTLLTLPVKSILAVSLTIGVAAAIVTLASPPAVAALLSGLGAAVTSAAIQVGRWLRRQRALLGFA